MKFAQKMTCGILVVAVVLFMVGCKTSGDSKDSSSAVLPEAQAAVQAESTDVPAAAATPAQPVQTKQSVPTESSKIKVENSEYDFGVVAPDSKDNKGRFTFTNVGQGTLKIDHVQSTCGCTVPELSKKEYAPGETGMVEITFHAPAHAGSVTKHLYIISNDPETPRAELALKAKVEVKVVAEPNTVELILNKDNAGMPSIKVKSLDNQPFKITGITVSGETMTFQFDPNEKATEHVLTPKVDISKLQALNSGVIQVNVDHPKAKQVLVSYNALPMYELRPARIVLQNAEPLVAVKREVGIVNNYGQEFEIESIQSRSGLMKVVEQKKDGKNIGLQLEITPPKQEGAVRRYITDELNVKIKDGPTLTVRCSGWYKL